MAKVSRKIRINASVGKVFDFVTKPENWTKYVTSLSDIKDVSSSNVEPGTTFRWTYRMLGINFYGRGHVIENIKNKRFSMKMEGGFPIHETYTFSSDNGGTELLVEIEYEAPSKIMSVVAKGGLIEKINKKEADSVLTKIKLLCEGL